MAEFAFKFTSALTLALVQLITLDVFNSIATSIRVMTSVVSAI